MQQASNQNAEVAKLKEQINQMNVASQLKDIEVDKLKKLLDEKTEGLNDVTMESSQVCPKCNSKLVKESFKGGRNLSEVSINHENYVLILGPVYMRWNSL